MSTNRIGNTLNATNLKIQLERFYANNKHSEEKTLEKTVELLTILVPRSDQLTTHRLKMHKNMINMLESYLDPYCKKYGIEIGIAFTLKSDAFGQSKITDWGDIFISIPVNTLSNMNATFKCIQKEDAKNDFEINEYGSNLKVKKFIKNFKLLGLHANSETTVCDKEMAKSTFGQGSYTAKMKK